MSEDILQILHSQSYNKFMIRQSYDCLRFSGTGTLEFSFNYSTGPTASFTQSNDFLIISLFIGRLRMQNVNFFSSCFCILYLYIGVNEMTNKFKTIVYRS